MLTKMNLSIEERLSQVEALIHQMEGGALPLEEALTQYEEGMKALSALEKELQSVQQKLTMLRRAADGTEEEVPLEAQE